MATDFSKLCHKEIFLAEFPSHHKLESEHDVIGVFLPWFKEKMQAYRRTTQSWPTCSLPTCGVPLAVKIMQFEDVQIQRVRIYIVCPNVKFFANSAFIEDILHRNHYL